MINGLILKSKFFNKFLICAFFLVLGAFPAKVFSQEKGAEGKTEKFEAGKTAMEHVADKHEWHVFGDLAVMPLPVILYTDKGFEFFSSAKLLPQGTVYQGKYYNYVLVNNKLYVANAAGA